MKTVSLIDDNVFAAARVALKGMTAKAEAISQNVANIDTPGYEAQTVSFEQAVKRVIDKQASDSSGFSKTSVGHMASPNQLESGFIRENRAAGNYRADKNNVDIEVEVMDMNETLMRFETLAQLLAKRYRLYKDVANSK